MGRVWEQRDDSKRPRVCCAVTKGALNSRSKSSLIGLAHDTWQEFEDCA